MIDLNVKFNMYYKKVNFPLLFSVTPGENLENLTHISEGDMNRHFKQNDSVDNLVAVPGLDKLTDIKEDDMERMMYVSSDMLGCELAQEDLDNLLDTNDFTNKMMLEKNHLTKVTEVPNVNNLTKGMFSDLKNMTDVKSVENLTTVDRASLRDSMAIKWLKQTRKSKGRP